MIDLSIAETINRYGCILNVVGGVFTLAIPIYITTNTIDSRKLYLSLLTSNK